MGSNEAYVTLATNDTYSMGALVLANSLRKVGSTRARAILITPEVTEHMRKLLSESYELVQLVDIINSNDEKILAVMKRPELGVTLTKVHCWTLTQYSKGVFLDADTLVVNNPDELFLKEEISAVPDIGWPDCFNSGVFVFKPSVDTFTALTQLAATEGSFDGGDQGLLNQYFNNWRTEDITKHLSFVYNMTLLTTYSYTPAYKRFGANVKIVHFLGSVKPWMYGYNPQTRQVVQPANQSAHLEHVQAWWDIFVGEVQPRLSSDCTGLASNLAQLSFEETSPTHQGSIPVPNDEISRRIAWEAGNVDYLGNDGFDNIQRKLDAAMGTGSS